MKLFCSVILKFELELMFLFELPRLFHRRHERFVFVRSRCRENLKLGDFTSLLCRVQRDHFSSFKQ